MAQNYKNKEVSYKKIAIQKLTSILVGNLLCVIALLLFLRPAQMIGGGTGGIAVLLNYVFRIPLAVTVILINLPLMAISFKILDKDFIIFSTISMLVFSIFMTIFDFLSGYIHITDDVLLSCVFGGIINGFGMGIMFRNGTTQGGMDIVAALFKKLYGINVSKVLMAINGVIIITSGYIYTFDRAMYTIIAFYIGYQVVDVIQLGVGKKKQVFIMTSHPNEISNEILVKVNRGVTFFKGIGGYTNNKLDVLYCVLDNREFVKTCKIVEQIDPDAFMSVSETVEVKGRGFRKIEL